MNSISTTTEAAPAEQERLARILDEYLVAIEQGRSVSPEELLANHPADADQLRGYLSGLNLFHAAAMEPGEPLLGGNTQPPGIPASLQTIGEYRLVRELGRGGMGVVYEAWQVSLRRRVALKVLPFTSSHDAKQLGRFKNEAQAAAQIQHPNIVPVFAIGENCGTNYYVMQLIEGQSVASVLSALRSNGNSPCDVTIPNNALTYQSRRAGSSVEPAASKAPVSQPPMRAADTADHVGVVARLGIQAAEALHAAHEYGVVHRDVKPSNLLLDDHGKLWVTDFGLARCRDDQGLTQSGDVLGTMRYMSPEQAQGRLSLIDHRTDIYSLGLTLYELATLHHPDDDASDVAKLFDRHRAAPKPLRHWNRHIANDFQTIVLKCLSEFPHDRYATAKELADDLQRFLEGQPILASPPSFASRVSKWAKRRRGLVYATAAVLLVTVVSVATSSVLLTRERQAAHEQVITTRLRDESSRLSNLYKRVAEELRFIPGAEKVTLEMLQEGVQAHERFVREVGDDPLFVADAASAQGSLGSLYQALGNRAAAVDAYSKAIVTWEKSTASEPNNQDYVRNLATSLNNLALLIADDGRQAEAIEMLQRAARLQESLAMIDSSSVDLATDVATTHSNLGLIQMRSQGKDAAAHEFRQAIQNPLMSGATTVEARRTLAASYNNLAALEEDAHPVAAAEAYKKAITLERELVRSVPINRAYQVDLARTYNNLGSLASKNNDWGNAEKCYSNAIDIYEGLASASPQVPGYRSDLAISYNNLGMAQSRSERFAEAEISFQKASQLLEEMLQADSANAQLLSAQGSVWNNLGMLRDRQHRTLEAATAYEKAIDVQSRALRVGNNNDTFLAMLSRHYFNYARNLAVQDKFDDALKVVLKRKALWADNSDRLFSVAQELALLQHQVAGRPNLDETNDACVQAAVSTLRDAINKGLPADRLHDASLAELADYAAFRQLLEERKVGHTSPAGRTSPELSRVN